ncbi:hypothetical protein L1D36_23060 [Vibrio mediterranei]|nr:hypothetical protein [Vibrio mediterranei]
MKSKHQHRQMQTLDMKIRELECKKLELECIKLEEETIAIKVKRRVLIATLAFTGVGLWLKYRG